ncbi:entericidin A/B family lipoprotein [Chitinimonas lacunae]|uniref:Entericidin A/B family lipoprotein n=1 Tax=Chitinimonas lacunae TaxID=1963018 RepID=A0ABV8MLP0_9NEIS
MDWTKRCRLLLIALALCATGCNTLRGIGQDIKKGGEAIENAARRG